MHRSGTSATTRLVNLLGVPIGDRADVKPPTRANAAGYWESNSLTAFNDRLLRTLGGSWAAPPRLGPGWERDPGLGRHRRRARQLFRRVHQTRQWVWKDPRTSVTLPFWLAALRVSPVAILTYRHPLDIARSLGPRYGIDKRLALALSERYMRGGLAGVRGLPVFVMPYDGLVLDPLGWCNRLRAFLERHGIACASSGTRRAAASIDRTLRHHFAGGDALVTDSDISPEQREIIAVLESRLGGHDAFPPSPLRSEPERVERLLAVRRPADLAQWSDPVRRGPIDRVLALPGTVTVPAGGALVPGPSRCES